MKPELERFKELSKMGVFCRREHSIVGETESIVWSVHHPLTKLKKKFNMQEVETYYDKYIALEDNTDLCFDEWFILTVYEESVK